MYEYPLVPIDKPPEEFFKSFYTLIFVGKKHTLSIHILSRNSILNPK